MHKDIHEINPYNQANPVKVSSEKCQIVAEILKPPNEIIDCILTRNPREMSINGSQIFLPPVNVDKKLKNDELATNKKIRVQVQLEKFHKLKFLQLLRQILLHGPVFQL